MSKVPVVDGSEGSGDAPPVYTQQPAGAAGGYQPPYNPSAPQQYAPQHAQYAPQPSQYPPQPAQYPPVIATQPVAPSPGRPYAQDLRDWDTPLFGCCEDAGVCVCGYFCGWCMTCGIMKEMGESQCYACLCPGQALHAARVKLRHNYAITGSLFDDQLISQCCFSCALCQLKRQLKMFKKAAAATGQLAA